MSGPTPTITGFKVHKTQPQPSKNKGGCRVKPTATYSMMNAVVEGDLGPWQDAGDKWSRRPRNACRSQRKTTSQVGGDPKLSPGRPKVIVICMLVCFNITGSQPGGSRDVGNQQALGLCHNQGLEGQVSEKNASEKSSSFHY